MVKSINCSLVPRNAWVRGYQTLGLVHACVKKPVCAVKRNWYSTCLIDCENPEMNFWSFLHAVSPPYICTSNNKGEWRRHIHNTVLNVMLSNHHQHYEGAKWNAFRFVPPMVIYVVQNKESIRYISCFNYGVFVGSINKWIPGCEDNNTHVSLLSISGIFMYFSGSCETSILSRCMVIENFWYMKCVHWLCY